MIFQAVSISWEVPPSESVNAHSFSLNARKRLFRHVKNILTNLMSWKNTINLYERGTASQYRVHIIDFLDRAWSLQHLRCARR